jgi:hypothetical protein
MGTVQELPAPAFAFPWGDRITEEKSANWEAVLAALARIQLIAVVTPAAVREDDRGAEADSVIARAGHLAHPFFSRSSIAFISADIHIRNYFEPHFCSLTKQTAEQWNNTITTLFADARGTNSVLHIGHATIPLPTSQAEPGG